MDISALISVMRQKVEAVDAATRDATGRGAHIIEGKIKMQLSMTSHQRGTPTPSQPGSPPSLVSGNLRRSITVEGPTGSGGHYEARIGPSIVYGRIQELGGDAGVNGSAHLPPRPYVAPGAAEAEPEVQAEFEQSWREALE